METQNLKQRNVREDEDDKTATAAAADMITGKGTGEVTGERKEKREAMAKHGLRSLGVAVAIPVLLTLTNIYMFGSSNTSDSSYYKTSNRPSWVPPVWTLHMSCLGSAFLMGLCGWIVWAEGGFHRKPNAVPIYLGQFGLSLLWDPIVFKMGSNWAGLVVAVGVCSALFLCHRMFKQVNHIAGDLVLPCLGWAGLLAFVNLKFLMS